MTILLVILGVLAVVVLLVISIYNGLVKKRTVCEEGWSSIDVQLKKRFDLIPNLVETVKGYATHEKGLFEEVARLRNMAGSATTVAEQAQVQSQLTGVLGRLIAVAESYPDLKANQNFIQLQTELSALEQGIEMARRFYNGAVRNFNIACETFPSVIIANMFNFAKKDFFEIAAPEERNVPKVEFK
jgi:LemA protein